MINVNKTWVGVAGYYVILDLDCWYLVSTTHYQNLLFRNNFEKFQMNYSAIIMHITKKSLRK